ncbi:nuclear autoantigenic sperm protein isoform X2 [Rhynchophorus ferrugineus]|uniref:Tetratricopeptide SHNi-TPR domain-containing protein n=1 Tax=Rhynchophorus ferrugineus TaxID=354439 RepID=A0A834ICE6_RHYFE|nr:hypothetical protein GWI33_008121 [Rhynchophorus ferrugineus]
MADVVVDPECTDPKELYGQGVRAFVLQDFEAAVAALSKASEILVAEHKDDLHESLGQVYLYYGKSLLGLAREQNEALGDAVPKNTEDSEDEDGDDENQETQEKTESNGDTLSVVKDKSENQTNNDKAESSPKECGEPGPSSVNGDDKEEETTDDQNGEEDPSDLQVAWEVLELAKKIFQKKDEKKNLAETLIILGEVSLESENFPSAINDIKQGLDIQKELFSKDSRSVAETFYKLGIAYSTNSQIDEAVKCFESSLEYLKNRIKTLEDIKVMSQENKDEIEEIQGLIPDIEEKVTDMNLYKEEAIKKISETIKESSNPSTTDSAGSSKRATDISHLVKRKRKIEEVTDEAATDKPAKKSSPPSE